MHLLLLLLLQTPAWADSTVQASHDVPVYQTPAAEARILFYLIQGERAQVTPISQEGYVRMRIKRGNKWRSGYLLKSDVASPLTMGQGRKWGFGGGYQYTYLSQKAKNFETEDQVKYTTTDYTSHSASPFLAAQYGQENFWRVTFSAKSTHYTSTAATDILGSNVKPIRLNHTFYSLLLQYGVSPFDLRHFYLGLGAELAKATKVQIVLGDQELASNSQDLPLYAGAQVFAGTNWFLLERLSAYADFRFTVIANQTPMIFQTEIVGGLMFWL